jgi:hypothetical protein
VNETIPESIPCNACGEPAILTPTPGITHHGRWDCVECDRFVCWQPEPMTDERALAFVMPYGRHHYRTLSQIESTDPGYLDWLLAEGEPRPTLRRAVEHVVSMRQGASDGARE